MIRTKTGAPRVLAEDAARVAANTPKLYERPHADVWPVDWIDTGCDVSKLCQTCPLVRCRYEEPNGIRSARNIPRNAEILALMEVGITYRDVVQRYGLSKRQAWRLLAALRKQTARPCGGV